MKVRHKRNIDDRIYDDCIAIGEWYIQQTHGISGHHKAFHNSDYEPLHVEHWQDVTWECYVVQTGTGIGDNRDLRHIMKDGEEELIAGVYACESNLYRLRKITLPKFEPLKNPSDLTPPPLGYAFLVERKVSE